MNNVTGSITPRFVSWFILFSSCGSHAELFDEVWKKETVDSARMFGISQGSLKIDRDGNQHVVFGGDYLSHAWFDGTQWNQETVNNETGSGIQADFVLDSAGNPHVIHEVDNDSSHRLCHTWRDYGGWKTETVLTSMRYDVRSTVEIDSADKIHIVFVRDHNSYQEPLEHAVRFSSGWTFETIADIDYSKGLSLTIDTASRLHVIYGESTGDGCRIQHAVRNDWGWSIATVRQLEKELSSDILASSTDQEQRPVLAYCYEGDLEISRFDGENWFDYSVVNSGAVTDCSSVKVGTGGMVHLVYFETNFAEIPILKHLQGNGTNWTMDIPGEEKGYDIPASLEIDTAGEPVIAGIASREKEFMVLNRSGDVWRSELVENTGGIGSKMDAVLDAGQVLRCVYFAGEGNQIRYARRTGSGWLTEIVENHVGGGEDCSIDVDAQGNTHIAYYSATTQLMKHAWMDASGWRFEAIDLTENVTSCALCIRNGVVSIAYVTDQELRICTKIDGEWLKETIDTDVRNSIAMHLEANLTQHIIYYKSISAYQQSIQYARKDQDHWSIQEIDTSSDYYFADPCCDIALDSKAQPHVVYQVRRMAGCPPERNLIIYAFQDQNGWHIEKDGGDPGMLSLQLDMNERPIFLKCGVREPCLLLRQSDQFQYINYPYDAGKGRLLIDRNNGLHSIQSNGVEMFYVELMFPETGVRIRNKYSGDITLEAWFTSHTIPKYQIPVVLALEYQGQYWFYPSWNNSFNTFYIELSVSPYNQILFSYYFPSDLTQHASGLTFLCAMLNNDKTAILGGLDGIGSWTFSY